MVGSGGVSRDVWKCGEKKKKKVGMRAISVFFFLLYDFEKILIVQYFFFFFSLSLLVFLFCFCFCLKKSSWTWLGICIISTITCDNRTVYTIENMV